MTTFRSRSPRSVSHPSIASSRLSRPVARTYWHVRGRNEAGEGPWSPTWSFTVEGTVGVDEEVILEQEIERVMAYDLLGRLVFSGTYQEWRSQPNGAYTVAVGMTVTGQRILLR